MHISQILKVAGGNEIPPPKPVEKNDNNDQISALMDYLRKFNEEHGGNMPDALANTVLQDYQVNDILVCAKRFQKEYFHDMPLSHNLEQKFVYNIPKSIYDGYRYAINNDLPDILNPVILLYPLLTDDPGDSFGMYLTIIRELIDGSREAIDNDSQCYKADLMEGYDEEETENE